MDRSGSKRCEGKERGLLTFYLIDVTCLGGRRSMRTMRNSGVPSTEAEYSVAWMYGLSVCIP